MSEQSDFKGRTIEFTHDDTGVSYRFRYPNTGGMNRYSKEVMEGNPAKANRNMVFGHLLSPSQAELEAQLEERPGLVFALANAINKETGLGDTFSRKN